MLLRSSLLFILLVSCFPLNAQNKKNWVLNGYTKYMQTNFITQTPGGTMLLTDNLIHNRVNTKHYIGKRITIAVELRTRVFYGEYTKNIPFYGDSLSKDPGLVDLSYSLINKDYLVLHTIFDRMYFNYNHQKWNLRVGRQRINWGINTVWNPNDVFNALNYLDFDYEERRGVDAARFEYNINETSGFDIAIAPSKTATGQIAAIKYFSNYKGYDVQALVSSYKQNLTMGVGWAGNIKNAGFKGEISYFQPFKSILDNDATLSASIGVDYSFSKGWYGMGGLLYVSQGSIDPLIGSGITALSGSLSAKRLMPTRYTFLLMARKPLSASWNFSFTTMFSPGSNLLIVFPVFSYGIKTNWDLDFVAQSAFMENPSGFGHSGSGLFIRLKNSF